MLSRNFSSLHGVDHVCPCLSAFDAWHSPQRLQADDEQEHDFACLLVSFLLASSDCLKVARLSSKSIRLLLLLLTMIQF